jgi:uncharacterized protein YciI
MALYAFVALKYLAPLDRMMQTLDRHRAYLRELHAQGKLVCSGPFVPREGGGLLLRVDDPAEIPALLAKDPYQMEKIVSHTVQVWDPNIGREGLDGLARPKV